MCSVAGNAQQGSGAAVVGTIELILAVMLKTV